MIIQGLCSRGCFYFLSSFVLFSLLWAGAGQAEELSLSDVVLFAHEDISLDKHSKLESGSIVVNEAGATTSHRHRFELSLDDVNAAPGTNLVADSIYIGRGSFINSDVFYNELVKRGRLTGAETTPIDLPVFDALPPFEMAPDEEGQPVPEDVTVRSRRTRELPEGDYGLLRAGKGSVVVFTGGVYNFREVDIDNGAKLVFTAPSHIRVEFRFSNDDHAYIGPGKDSNITARNIIFYVASLDGDKGRDYWERRWGDKYNNHHSEHSYSKNSHYGWGFAHKSSKHSLSGKHPEAVSIGQNSVVFANFYVTNGTLHLGKKSFFTGAVLAQHIKVDDHVRIRLDSAFEDVNQFIETVDDSLTVNQGETATVLDSGETSVLANDTLPSGVIVVSPQPVGGPFHGSVSLQPDGTFSYTHDGSGEFSDSFVYEVCDKTDPEVTRCSTATVHIVVLGPTITLNLAFLGDGGGRVNSVPAGLDCTADCTTQISTSQQILLSATADADSQFVAWGGDPDCADGNLIPDGDKNCTVIFNLKPPPPTETVDVTVQLTGAGSGSVTSEPAGIDCPANSCSGTFIQFTRVALTATPAEGSVFTGWSGDADCLDGDLTGDASATCIANFDIAPPPEPSARLTMGVAGPGTVSSSPPGISCSTNEPVCHFDCDADSVCGTEICTPAPGCEADFPLNTSVRFLVRSDSGESLFINWGGDADCSDGLVTMDADKTCSALLSTTPIPDTVSVSVAIAGEGSGVVTSSPAGINCPAGNCTAAFPVAGPITLTPAADAGSVFAGWSGDPDCADGVLDGTADASCTATFDSQTPTSVHLSVQITTTSPAAGAGDVNISPVRSTEPVPGFFQFFGATCRYQSSEGECEFDYPPDPIDDPSGTLGLGTEVTLTPSTGDAPNAAFIGWSGNADCSDGVVTMDANKTCIAEFGPASAGTRSITVQLGGEGSGTVTSTPAGINCPGTCTASFNQLDSVTLTPVADAGSVFAGWLGKGCSEGSVAGTGDASCTAIFDLENPSPSFQLTVNATGVGGTVTSTPAGIICATGSTCAEDFPENSVVTLTPVPDNAEFTFVGWSGDADCTDGVVTMDADKSCTAEFASITVIVSVTIAPSIAAGTVTSTPAGIDCPFTACTAAFTRGTPITLTPTANAGWAFAGWSNANDGGDEATLACENGVLDGNADAHCIATFEQSP